jgi:hypothetical protein
MLRHHRLSGKGYEPWHYQQATVINRCRIRFPRDWAPWQE